MKVKFFFFSKKQIVGEEHPGELILNSNLYNQEEKEKILFKNAIEFLGIKDWQQQYILENLNKNKNKDSNNINNNVKNSNNNNKSNENNNNKNNEEIIKEIEKLKVENS